MAGSTFAFFGYLSLAVCLRCLADHADQADQAPCPLVMCSVICGSCVTALRLDNAIGYSSFVVFIRHFFSYCL